MTLTLFKKYRTHLLILLIIIILVSIAALLFSKQLYTHPPVPNTKISIESFNQDNSKKESPQTIYVQRVTTPEAIATGLMHRKEPLGPNKGMLFDKGKWSTSGFWMKNTHIPLDILFLDDSYQVIDILYDMIPLDTTSRNINKPWRYAIEINARTMRHIDPGAYISIVEIDKV